MENLNTIDITNADFLKNIFKGLHQDEYIWTTSFSDSPNSNNSNWKGQRMQPEFCNDAKFGNAYFSIAAFRGGNARSKQNFSRLFCVVLDDAGESDIESTWRLRTSENKIQIGFLLDTPITDINIADRLHQCLTMSGHIQKDASGNNSVRYVRLPICINTKYTPAFPCKLEKFDPEKRYLLMELIKILGINPNQVLDGLPSKLGDHINSVKQENVSDGEYIKSIISGENYHEAILKLTARYVSRGFKPSDIREHIEGFMESTPDKGSERWKNRYQDINRMIDGALDKYAPSSPSIDQPLLIPCDYSTEKLLPVEFVIEGFISTGITMIAGEPGIGKSSMLVPLACCVAHLCQDNDPLKPYIRRKVFYVTEDSQQVERILYGIRKHLVPQFADKEFKEWFVVVHAKRLNPSDLSREIRRIQNEYINQIDEFTAKPLIVLDTSNATLDIDNENDNSEVGKAIALIKEVSDGNPIWIVAHMPKTNVRDQIKELTVRGASAFTGDSQATLFIFKDDNLPDRRFLKLGKHRFSEEFDEVSFNVEAHYETVQTPWGKSQKQKYLVGKPERSSMISRQQEIAEIRNSHRAAAEFADQQEVLDAIREATATSPMTRTRLKQMIPKKNEDVMNCINKLVKEGKVELS